jgi:hypothetical protein
LGSTCSTSTKRRTPATRGPQLRRRARPDGRAEVRGGGAAAAADARVRELLYTRSIQSGGAPGREEGQQGWVAKAVHRPSQAVDHRKRLPTARIPAETGRRERGVGFL